MNEKYNYALKLAMEAHATQYRKGTNNKLGISVPYITHPIAVSALVVRYDGNEDQVIAALLHDVLEDGNPSIDWSGRILSEFGPKVLEIVEGCTDGKPQTTTGQKEDWRIRKERYLSHLKSTDEKVLLVSACDKLHNLQAIYLDLNELGLSVFERFSAKRDDVLWYYKSLSDIFKQRGVVPAQAIAIECQAIEDKLKKLSP